MNNLWWLKICCVGDWEYIHIHTFIFFLIASIYYVEGLSSLITVSRTPKYKQSVVAESAGWRDSHIYGDGNKLHVGSVCELFLSVTSRVNDKVRQTHKQGRGQGDDGNKNTPHKHFSILFLDLRSSVLSDDSNQTWEWVRHAIINSCGYVL